VQVIESWQDHDDDYYAIVRHSREEQKLYKDKEFEAMWANDGELFSVGGTVGYTTATYDSLEEAQDFLLKGISLKDANKS
jgi:hypothetical protein